MPNRLGTGDAPAVGFRELAEYPRHGHRDVGIPAVANNKPHAATGGKPGAERVEDFHEVCEVSAKHARDPGTPETRLFVPEPSKR